MNSNDASTKRMQVETLLSDPDNRNLPRLRLTVHDNDEDEDGKTVVMMRFGTDEDGDDGGSLDFYRPDGTTLLHSGHNDSPTLEAETAAVREMNQLWTGDPDNDFMDTARARMFAVVGMVTKAEALAVATNQPIVTTMELLLQAGGTQAIGAVGAYVGNTKDGTFTPVRKIAATED